MITEKELQKAKVAIRKSYSNNEIIKVVYLGQAQGFHFGKIITAIARHARRTNLPFPHPKYAHVDYQIKDYDGDLYTVSEDGVKFRKGWYPVPNHWSNENLFDETGKFKWEIFDNESQTFSL